MCDSPSSSSGSSGSSSSGSSTPSGSDSGDGNGIPSHALVYPSGASSRATNQNEFPEGYFGVGGYYNIRHGIVLKQISSDFQGLFAEEFMPKGTVLWFNREDGPAEAIYRKIYGQDLRHLKPEELKYFIRYSYQNDDEFFISPLRAEEVDVDYSNYWNHSCDPNTLPSDEDHWVAIRDIQAGEQLTIDYATFDSNPFICIERCLCQSPHCRKYIRGDDYRIKELQERYAGHFLPYIQKRIDEEARVLAAGHGLVMTASKGGNVVLNDFSAASVRAFHDEQNIDIEAHNQAGLAALFERFAPPSGTNNGRALSYVQGKRTYPSKLDDVGAFIASPPPIFLPSASDAQTSSSSSSNSDEDEEEMYRMSKDGHHAHRMSPPSTSTSTSISPLSFPV